MRKKKNVRRGEKGRSKREEVEGEKGREGGMKRKNEEHPICVEPTILYKFIF